MQHKGRTNIRTVHLHQFLKHKQMIPGGKIVPFSCDTRITIVATIVILICILTKSCTCISSYLGAVDGHGVAIRLVLDIRSPVKLAVAWWRWHGRRFVKQLRLVINLTETRHGARSLAMERPRPMAKSHAPWKSRARESVLSQPREYFDSNIQLQNSTPKFQLRFRRKLLGVMMQGYH